MIFTAIRDILHIMLWGSYPLCIVGDVGGSAVALAHDLNVEAVRARKKAKKSHNVTAAAVSSAPMPCCCR